MSEPFGVESRFFRVVSDGQATPGSDPIAIMLPDLTVGGAERVALSIANGLADRGFPIELLLSRYRGALIDDVNEAVSVIEFGPKRTAGIGVAANVPAMISYCHQRRPRAVLPHLEHPTLVWLTATSLANVETSVIPTQHSTFGESPDETLKDRFVRRMLPRLYPRADRVIAVSQGVAQALVEQTPLAAEEISVLYNPVDVAKIRGLVAAGTPHAWGRSPDIELVAFLGRLAEQKDLETWLRAFRAASETRGSLRGIVIGTGPARDSLLERAEALGISDAIEMPGYVENPFPTVAAADAFMLTSRYEGLPTVLIEALACETPIVATDCPHGPREILAGGRYGALAPVGDVTAVATALEDTMENPPDGTALRGRAKEFSPGPTLDAYEAFIDRYISQRDRKTLAAE